MLLIVFSMGKDGNRAYYKDLCVEGKPFLQENTIETTGAGDTFGALRVMPAKDEVEKLIRSTDDFQ